MLSDFMPNRDGCNDQYADSKTRSKSLKSAYVALIGAIILAAVSISLGSTIFVDGRVFVPGTAYGAAGYVGGIGAYVMALGWLSIGAFFIFAALMNIFRRRHSFFERSRDIALFTFAVSFFFAVFGRIVQGFF
jgi:hypothetical protein